MNETLVFYRHKIYVPLVLGSLHANMSILNILNIKIQPRTFDMKRNESVNLHSLQIDNLKNSLCWFVNTAQCTYA